MKDVMGLIYTGENDIRLRELTLVRAVAALPVAGRYRVIDFLMSSMVNSGVRNVGDVYKRQARGFTYPPWRMGTSFPTSRRIFRTAIIWKRLIRPRCMKCSKSWIRRRRQIQRTATA